jgi:hypothetical protein
MYVFMSILVLVFYSLLFFVAGEYFSRGLYPGSNTETTQEIETLRQENLCKYIRCDERGMPEGLGGIFHDDIKGALAPREK